MDTPTITSGIELSAATTAPKTPEQLRALAAQFEALLVGQMLQQMRQSMFENDDDKANGLGAGPLADAMFSEISLALSRAGGMGLGQSLIAPLAAAAGMTAAPAATTAPLAVSSRLPPASVAPASLAAMPGRLSSGYGWRKDPIHGDLKFHNGLDLAMPKGRDVPAARTGEVAFAGQLPGYGLTVDVKHEGRVSTRYAHLSEILVQPGEAVSAGQTVGLSGATGRATGPHLHFEVLQDGRPVNPSEAW
ncbi:MAG: peptidoglycan DD-metalloendopeptidase family protein [Vicinamibacterales bacterium]